MYRSNSSTNYCCSLFCLRTKMRYFVTWACSRDTLLAKEEHCSFWLHSSELPVWSFRSVRLSKFDFSSALSPSVQGRAAVCVSLCSSCSSLCLSEWPELWRLCFFLVFLSVSFGQPIAASELDWRYWNRQKMIPKKTNQFGSSPSFWSWHCCCCS